MEEHKIDIEQSPSFGRIMVTVRLGLSVSVMVRYDLSAGIWLAPESTFRVRIRV